MTTFSWPFIAWSHGCSSATVSCHLAAQSYRVLILSVVTGIARCRVVYLCLPLDHCGSEGCQGLTDRMFSEFVWNECMLHAVMFLMTR